MSLFYGTKSLQVSCSGLQDSMIYAMKQDERGEELGGQFIKS